MSCCCRPYSRLHFVYNRVARSKNEINSLHFISFDTPAHNTLSIHNASTRITTTTTAAKAKFGVLKRTSLSKHTHKIHRYDKLYVRFAAIQLRRVIA